MKRHLIDVIAGDGIGPEIMPSAIAVVEKVAPLCGFGVDWRHRPWGSAYYGEHGEMMPADGLAELATGDAVLLGAVGMPGIPDDVTLWGLLIPIRRGFRQCVNLRPVRTLPGIPSPLRCGDGIDIVVVRENVEGEYSEIGGHFGTGTDGEMAIQESVFTRAGIVRVADFAARLAGQRRGTLTSATKSNGIIHTMPFWDRVVADTVALHDGIALERVLVDALAARMVLHPQSLDVIVASNLFGDILSDLAAALTGSIGVAASANLNPEGTFPSMFEPVHGSAPDIAGTGVANPIGQVSSAALMLEHLGHTAAAEMIMTAIDLTLRSGARTRDLGGTASTDEFTAALLEHIG